MPHTVDELRVLPHVDQAYVLFFDGIPLAFTTDASGELTGTGGSTYIARSETTLGESGGREIVGGLVMPQSLEMGGLSNVLGLPRTNARFSVLLTPETAAYFSPGGEEPEEMLGRLAPTTSPAPATVVGVTVRDRHIGLEYIGPAGERRMYPFLPGENLPGFDHLGDTDGATVPASVSETPMVHEGRLVALYRVYRDPSAISTTQGRAWPTLDNYRPIWVGKMRDAGTIDAGGRITIECTGFESLLERNMATGASQPFKVRPEFTTEPGIDDQVAIFCGTGPGYNGTNVLGRSTYRGRSWTTLSGDHQTALQNSLHSMIQDTISGVDTDYELGQVTFDSVDGGDAGISGNDIYVKRDQLGGTPWFHMEIRIAMHRRRWLALGFDPEQQDWPGMVPATENQKQIEFRRLSAGTPFIPRDNASSMGTVPGAGYYRGVFHTVAVGSAGGVGGIEDWNSWDNDGSDRHFSPQFPSQVVYSLRPDAGQVIRTDDRPALLPQSHVPYSGSIDGTPCTAAGYFLIKGKIRKGDGSTDDASLKVEAEAEQVVIARCSWIAVDDYFPSDAGGVTPALYVEELYDPRKFGYPFRPLDRDWATLDLEAVQLHTFATEATNPEMASQTLSAFLRSTGTSTGPAGGVGVIDQGDNSGTSIGWYGDILAPEMGLAVPDMLLPSGTELSDAFDALPAGEGGPLARCRIAYEGSFSSYDTLRALLEPRGLRVGFDGGRFMLYRLRDASPADATVHILESDLYGSLGNPDTVKPKQKHRALAPVDAWKFSYAEQSHELRARDPSAPMRRGDNVREVSGRGLIAEEFYADDPASAPLGASWKSEAETLFGQHEARFLARRHGQITLPVSRPKGQDLYPGTIVTVSNPWVWNEDGTQGVSGVVGIVVRAVHHTHSAHCDADILVFEGQWQPPPLYAPMSWVEGVVDSTTLTRATSSDFMGRGSDEGWTRPEWSAGGGGNAIGVLIRMLPDGTWAEVGTAEIDSVTETTINLATPLSAMPPDHARTMIFMFYRYDVQPEWLQEIYSAIGYQGNNDGVRRFV